MTCILYVVKKNAKRAAHDEYFSFLVGCFESFDRNVLCSPRDRVGGDWVGGVGQVPHAELAAPLMHCPSSSASPCL